MPITTPASVCTSVRVAWLSSAGSPPGAQFRKAEVEHLHEAVLPDDHVLRLEITVNDADRVRGAGAGGNLDRDVQRGLQGGRLRLQQVPERLPLDVLHRDERMAVGGLAEGVHHADVGMTERRGGPRLLLEPANPGMVRRHLAGQHLDRHVATELQVIGQVHLAHATGAEWPADLVVTKLRSGSQRHC